MLRCQQASALTGRLLLIGWGEGAYIVFTYLLQVLGVSGGMVAFSGVRCAMITVYSAVVVMVLW